MLAQLVEFVGGGQTPVEEGRHQQEVAGHTEEGEEQGPHGFPTPDTSHYVPPPALHNLDVSR